MVINIEKEKYVFHRKGGKSIIERCPVFAPDGDSLSVIVENTVRFYNLQTGDCVRTLETETYLDDLVAIEFPQSENYNLYGCSVRGCVTVWTWENGAVLREVTLQTPEDMKVLSFNVLDQTSCLVVSGSPSIKHMIMAKYSLRTGQLIEDFQGTQPIYYNMVRVALGMYMGDRFAAMTNGTKILFIQNLTRPHVRTQIINHNHIRIMSVAVHNGAVALSDALGRVTILKGNIYDSRTYIAREQLHWHFLPCLAVAFSLQGNYIYSGGMEKVLLKWTLGNVAQKANDKSFMPRLPGIIKYIATNNTHVAVTLTNNSVVIANTQLYATCTILECGGLSPVMRALGGSLIYNAKLGGLIMPGRTGHLQLYSTETEKVLYNIDITQMNELPSERYNLLPLDTEVTCVAISADGSWLATSEYRNDGVNYPEERLKFWAATKGIPFTLNTCVNLSHGGCNIVSLAFNKAGNICVSAGADQKFRIWQKNNISLTKARKFAWSCLTACYYSSGVGSFLSHGILNDYKKHDVRNYGPEQHPYLRQIQENDVILKLSNIHKEHALIAENVIKRGMRTDPESDLGEVAISQDGSLIAAWFGCKLTLWDTHLCNLRTSLSHPALRPKGLHVKFGSQDAAHYLVSTSENCLAVWSLLSLTIKWYVQMKVSCLAADEKTNKMAVATVDNDVFVFTPHSPTPLLTRKSLLNPQTGVFKQITFGSINNSEQIRLYLMRNNSEIYCIEPEKSDDTRLEVLSWRNKPVSNFGAMMAVQQISEVKAPALGEVEAVNSKALGKSAVAEIASAAPHMLPPLNLLSASFLEKISGLKTKHKEESSDGEESANEEDREEMSSEDEERREEEDVIEIKEPVTPPAMELWAPNYDAVKQKKLHRICKDMFLDTDATGAIFGV